jgi:hypothetical protein
MRCQGCDYPLWNLTTRTCPECGRPFRPSEFQFVPNSVRFLCPGCGQDYYGTGKDGHLVPQEFDCVRCHRHLSMDEMVLLPTEGVAEKLTEPDRVPRLDRRRIGFFRGWGGTIWRAMFDPGRLARSLPPDSSVIAAWVFAVLTGAAILLTGLSPVILFVLIGGPRGGPASMLPEISVFACVAVAIIALAIPAWALIGHAVLRLTGRTRQGPGATVRTFCYAAAPAVLMGIPCVGPQFMWVIGWIWPAVSAAVMLRHTQGVSGGRATIAALTAPLLIAGAATLLVLFAMIPAISNATTAVARAQSRATQGSVQTVLGGLRAHAGRHGGRYPAHALSLVIENDVLPGELTPPVMGQSGSRPPSALDHWDLLTEPQRANLAARLAAAIPAGAAAHRLGDFVFTYHGVTATADPGVWLVIYDPPATARDFHGNPLPLSVGLLNGSVLTFPRQSFAVALAQQNALRAGLPQIPDPSTAVEPGTGGN